MHIKYGKKIVWQRKDAWSMDLTLAPIIASGIKYFQEQIVQLKKEGNGFVGVPSMKGFFEVDNSYDAAWDSEWELAWVEWHRRLDLMLYAFENWQDSPTPGKGAINMEVGEASDNGLHSCKITHPDEAAYAEYQRLSDIHNEKTKLGMQYFSEHFADLWW